LRTFQELADEGYELDRFGRMKCPKGWALPVYQGSMVDAFDASGKVFSVGAGAAGGKWIDQPPNDKHILAHYYMTVEDLNKSEKARKGLKVVAPKVSNPENGRTMFACLIEDFPSVDSVNTGQLTNKNDLPLYCVVAVMNSLVFDFALRTRMGGLNMNPFVVLECPYPSNIPTTAFTPIALSTLRLCGNIANFAPQWLKFRRQFPELEKREWKHWWAVTEADRLRLRVEIDALCADLYGLDPDDFDWIVRDEPSDPKGFWRVDRHLPLRERLTGLAAAAFRALKQDKWSAESAATLNNDEFFEIIGIPEMTTGTEPLIRKRDGCHCWNPEEFGKDDPRHGWTWQHCLQDAVALLGSDETVREYVEGEQEVANEVDEEEVFQLRSDPPKRKKRT
jgi:hypothetical protein